MGLFCLRARKAQLLCGEVLGLRLLDDAWLHVAGRPVDIQADQVTVLALCLWLSSDTEATGGHVVML